VEDTRQEIISAKSKQKESKYYVRSIYTYERESRGVERRDPSEHMHVHVVILYSYTEKI
jgi:hypothetical protein